MSCPIIDHALKRLVKTGRVIIARYREDCPSSERPRISISQPGRTWAACGPTKRPTFFWWNVQMHSIYQQCCILTKFRFVIKSYCVFSSIDMLCLVFFYPGNTFFNELMHGHHVSVNLILNFSLLQVQTRVDQHKPKYMQIFLVHRIDFCV